MTIYNSDKEYDTSSFYDGISGFPGLRGSVGWSFRLRNPSGLTREIHPIVDGATLSHDSTRRVRRTVTSLKFLQEERDGIDFSADRVEVYMRVQRIADPDPVDYPIGVFNFTNSARQVNAYRRPDTGEAADLWIVELSDELVRLHRNTGAPETVLSGADPTFEMNRILEAADLLHAIAGSASDTQEDFTWDGSTKELDKFYQLAEVAGHRPPWADNLGIIRSVAAAVIEEDIIKLEEKAFTVEGTVAITENYLTAPNRVIVVDSGPNAYAIRGQWDAPSVAPHSLANRGYVQTEIVAMQGLSGTEHANEVARTIGEQYAARTLSVTLATPTNVLDGPVVFSFSGVVWLLDSWSISFAPDGQMQINATEIFLP